MCLKFSLKQVRLIQPQISRAPNIIHIIGADANALPI